MNNQLLLLSRILLAISFIWIVVETATVVQCNLGLKMYSVESGNTICASLSPFKCIEACEWNTSCALTSHYTAFRGKRSYVAGMVLTNTTFLVQCCASLATIVQTNSQQEPICVWVPEVETVEERGSFRLDPPLSSNEYIREIKVERKGNGQVIVKAQICKYSVQRMNCDKETMSPEDSRFYSLLLLRLSRTKAFLNDGNKTSLKTSFGGSFRDESPLTNFRSLAKHSPFNTNPPVQSQRTTISNKATTVAGEAGGNFSISADQTLSNNTSSTAATLLDGANSSNIDNRNDSSTNDLKWRVHKDQPMPSFPWKNDHPDAEHPAGRNAIAAIPPRTHHLHIPPLGRPLSSSTGVSKAENLPLITAVASSTLQFIPHKTEIASAHRQLTASSSPRETLLRQKLWPIATNSTKELIASSHWTIGDHDMGLDESPRHDEAGMKSEERMSKQGRWLSSRSVSVSSPLQELAIKSELEIRKLHEGEHHHTTSGGGSFSGGWQPVSNTEAFRQIEEQLAAREKGLGSSPSAWSATTNSTLPKAPSFKIIPVSHSQPFATTTRIIHRPYTSHRHVGERVLAKELNRDEMEKEVYKNWRLHGLLDCCQTQAPGCRQLCSKDVSKEQIKKAITSQQCAPLQMTSVIQCFPRFYNTTSVSKCCARTPPLEADELSKSAATVIPTQTANKLPEQCLSLCSPDFKLSFAHFACIDHISTIVECYRDLMR